MCADSVVSHRMKVSFIMNTLSTSDFYYDLPKELIAQHPAEPRDSCRLLTLDKNSGAVGHSIFHQLPTMLRKGDLLVVNNSKVIPARLLGVKPTGAVCELLLLRQRGNDVWECLARPGKRLQAGAQIIIGEGVLNATIQETLPDGNKLVKFTYQGDNIFTVLDQVGKMPLPPYITEQLQDNDQYQTIYAAQLGSAAAPTAGLHFTQEVFEQLSAIGVDTAEVTLHVGLGTFRPVQEDDIRNHQMHTEWYSLDEENAAKINAAKAAGNRVICVGTTSCRTLESVWQKHGAVCASSGETDIFIYPGYKFGVMDGLLTNFHLPESTLIMLVSAFAGYENTMQAYRIAVQEKYRFFSFGDAMLIL